MSDGLLHDERVTLWGLFLEAHEGIKRRLAQELHHELGISPHWLEVLLRVGRSPGQGVRMTDLAEMVLFSSGGLTKLADRMEQAGLIRRTPCPEDRRSSLVTLTQDGRRLLDRALAIHVPSIQRHLIEHLDPEQRRQLEHILRTLRAATQRSAGTQASEARDRSTPTSVGGCGSPAFS